MQFCECTQDGLCPRYNREMSGRLREICQGENVDVGLAASFRKQWQDEKDMQPSAHLWNEPTTPIPLVLKTTQAPGDALVMTAAIHSLHRAHPGKFLTAIESEHPAIFENNPDVINVSEAKRLGTRTLTMHYPAIAQANDRGIHFMQAYCEYLGSALGIHIPLMTNRPYVYLTDEEKRWQNPNVPEQYWLIVCGGKKDFTNKFWGKDRFQSVVDDLRGTVRCVQVGAKNDDHPPLRGVVNLTGKTTLRELICLAYHADGILCGVTFLHHLAAAMQKPCVTIMGGREPVLWESYQTGIVMHTTGMFDCCQTGGCWKSRVKPLGDGSHEDNSLCERPVGDFPSCMRLITPDEVVRNILKYSA